jgi:DNA ligase-1
MGKLLVRGINGEFKGVEFKIGSGFTDAHRILLWNQPKIAMIGSIVKYKYFKVGCKDKPRQPIYLGFRKD